MVKLTTEEVELAAEALEMYESIVRDRGLVSPAVMDWDRRTVDEAANEAVEACKAKLSAIDVLRAKLRAGLQELG